MLSRGAEMKSVRGMSFLVSSYLNYLYTLIPDALFVFWRPRKDSGLVIRFRKVCSEREEELNILVLSLE